MEDYGAGTNTILIGGVIAILIVLMIGAIDLVPQILAPQITAVEIAEQFPQLTPAQCQTLANGRVWLGVTDNMARIAWGNPTDVNSSVGSWGRHEQWVYQRSDYSAQYLYFENGYLTSWQN